jgi:hypothetical protein
MAKKNGQPQSNLAQLLAAMKHPAAATVAAADVASAPAATAPLPAWVDAAVAAQAAQPAPAVKVAEVKQPASLTRTWSLDSTGISKAGNPYIVFATSTKNGQPFKVTVPADLVAFISRQAN